MLELAALFPHPPIVIPAVGKKESEKVSKTAEAMEKLAQEISDARPEVVIALTPHGHVFRDAVTITVQDELCGDLGRFGAPQIRVAFSPDRDIAAKIISVCKKTPVFCTMLDSRLIREYGLSPKLDHGLVVPLSFLARTGWRGKLVPVNVGLLPYEELYHFGVLMRDALEETQKRWVLLISGDMSHCLIPGAPAGFSEKGAAFDEVIGQIIREGDPKRIFSLDPEFIEEAAECGLRPLVIGFGALDGYEIKGEVLSYEGTFGVGYIVAKMMRQKKSAQRQLWQAMYRDREKKKGKRRAQESELVRLARDSIKYYLAKGQYLSPIQTTGGFDKIKAGAFVSLKKNGRLRGCIGTIEPVFESLPEEVIHNAVSAAFHDPRFEPLQPDELDELEISVDVLEKPEPISGPEELDPDIYGVIVTSGRRRGLLLPQLSGIKTAAEQIRIAREKAGIGQNERIILQRFRVTRYT